MSLVTKKYKQKVQKGAISDLLGWLNYKKRKIKFTDDNVEKIKLLHIANDNRK